MRRAKHHAARSSPSPRGVPAWALPLALSFVLTSTPWPHRALAQQSPSAAPIPPGRPVVLDQVIAVIGGDIILQSDVNEEMRFAVLQPYRTGSGDTPEDALKRLIDRHLILQQMKFGQAATPPSPQQVQQQLSALSKQIPDCVPYHCDTEAGWLAFLKAADLTPQEVERYWSQRMLILSFIQSRFGAGIRIDAREIQQYYQQELVPEFARRKLSPPPVAAVSGRIREILLQQHVDSLLEDWLKSLRAEGSVSILDPAYGKLGDTASDNPGGAPGAQP